MFGTAVAYLSNGITKQKNRNRYGYKLFNNGFNMYIYFLFKLKLFKTNQSQ